MASGEWPAVAASFSNYSRKPDSILVLIVLAARAQGRGSRVALSFSGTSSIRGLGSKFGKAQGNEYPE